MSEAPQVLYRIRNAESVRLYVGRSLSITNRIRRHQQDQPWWREAVSIELEHFETREEVAAAEVKAIREEGPVHNVLRYRPRVGNPTFVIHIEDDLWDGLKQAEQRTSLRRGDVIRQFIKWFLRVPGYGLPPRP